MPTLNCGFDDAAGVTGRDLLIFSGPTILVDIGFDPNYKSGIGKPAPGISQVRALVDSGATTSCIDAALAMQLNLPIVDRQMISGAHGAKEVNMHLAQLYCPPLDIVITGFFAAVDLVAGGQSHQALIGRTFLQMVVMNYDGRTGKVTLST